MSLYNLMHGRNPASRLLLAMLDLTEADVGRFRDCYLVREEEGEKALQIHVYTRNGGGNREDYESVTEALQAHPAYVRDFDEDHDCTYASYVFRVPEKFKATADELATFGGEHKETPAQRFEAMLEKLKSGDKEDPAVKKMLAVGEQIFGAIKDGETVIKI